MSATAIAPRFVPPRFVPKIWGATELQPWFPDQAEKIGEVWFPAGELLIKFLFTTENLSVQVHPDDAYAARHENSRGKTEMWYILRAEPDAQVALGFVNPIAKDEAAELCRTGAIMDHLAWRTAHAGDTFFTPAGTVHAIGKGLALCEIQENSDVTYRIFDYGRPRELHIDRALDVSEWTCHAGAAATRKLGPDTEELVQCGHFSTIKVQARGTVDLPGDQFAIVLEGAGSIGGSPFRPGTVWELGPGETRLEPADEAVVLLTGAGG